MQIRFERYTLRGALRFKPQWRKRETDMWRDVFIAAFSNLRDAVLWARREYGSSADIEEN